MAKKAFEAVARKSVSNISVLITDSFQGDKEVDCTMQLTACLWESNDLHLTCPLASHLQVLKLRDSLEMKLKARAHADRKPAA